MDSDKIHEAIKNIFDRKMDIPDIPDISDYSLKIDSPKFDYENTFLKEQADDIANRLLPIIEKSNRDSKFSIIAAIISIIIALISAVIAGISLALQFGLLSK